MRTAGFLLLYAAAAILGTYLAFCPTFESGFAAIQTERGDGLLNHYILENSWLSISEPNYRGSPVSPPMFFPTKWTIYYSENLFGVAPLYWLLRLVLPFDLAYAWWQILLNLLNFVVFAFVARWLKWPHLVAIGGAFLWAFAMVHADQIKHQQMIGRFWMPLAVYYAIALIMEPSTKAWNRLLGCIFMQNLACVYTGWFLMVGLAVFVPFMLRMYIGSWSVLKQFARENKRKVLRITGWWCLAMAALFLPYILVNLGIGRTYDESDRLMPTPSAWITGPPDSKWIVTTSPYRDTVFLECWLFSGFTIYALMIASAVSVFFQRERIVERAIIGAAMVTVVVWMLCTLAPEDKGLSLWWVVRFIPGGWGIRCVSRVYLIVYLFGSIAGLTWLTQVTQRIRSEWLRFAVQAVVIGAMIFEQTEYQQPSFERKNVYPLIDTAAEQLKGAKAGWVEPHYVDPTGKYFAGPDGEVFAMWVGMRANVPVINGYSGRTPRAFPPYGTMTDEKICEWLKGKYRGKVRVVDTEAPPGQQVREIVVE